MFSPEALFYPLGKHMSGRRWKKMTHGKYDTGKQTDGPSAGTFLRSQETETFIANKRLATGGSQNVWDRAIFQSVLTGFDMHKNRFPWLENILEGFAFETTQFSQISILDDLNNEEIKKKRKEKTGFWKKSKIFRESSKKIKKNFLSLFASKW